MGYGALEGRWRLGRRHVEVLFGLLFRIVRQLVVIVGKLPGPRGVFLRWRDSLRFGTGWGDGELHSQRGEDGGHGLEGGV